MKTIKQRADELIQRGYTKYAAITTALEEYKKDVLGLIAEFDFTDFELNDGSVDYEALEKELKKRIEGKQEKGYPCALCFGGD